MIFSKHCLLLVSSFCRKFTLYYVDKFDKEMIPRKHCKYIVKGVNLMVEQCLVEIDFMNSWPLWYFSCLGDVCPSAINNGKELYN